MQGRMLPKDCLRPFSYKYITVSFKQESSVRMCLQAESMLDIPSTKHHAAENAGYDRESSSLQRDHLFLIAVVTLRLVLVLGILRQRVIVVVVEIGSRDRRDFAVFSRN